jgi:hypothetical protein
VFILKGFKGGGDEESAEDVVDVGGGEEMAMKGDGNFVAPALGLEELQLLRGMEGAEGRMGRAAQHAAAAAVGKLKLPLRSDTSTGIVIGHGSLLKWICVKAKEEMQNAKLEMHRLREPRKIRPDY